MFNDEKDFEDALCTELTNYGWDKNILNYCSVNDLVDNWAEHLFRMNKDVLCNVPLSENEKQVALHSLIDGNDPVAINELITAGLLNINRDKDSPDIKHQGKAVYLRIYDRDAIAGGTSAYQIARQTILAPANDKEKDRRGDVTLLINGLPFIHIELKKDGIPIEQAETQIEKYSDLHIFKGFMSVVQIFMAMNPSDMVYFANVGANNQFDRKYYFHWANSKNQTVTYWKDIVKQVLSIPMAHQLVGYYTVPDKSDRILKVMRSYQIHATQQIRDRVFHWDRLAGNNRGGYIWHTTGSGKTMTSFKAAQIITAEVDKVVFLTDRIELGSQSTMAYQNFGVEGKDLVVEASSASAIISHLTNNSANAPRLITVSMQKMDRLSKEEFDKYQKKIREADRQRLVFIIDEGHRSVYGNMMKTIKEKFPHALLFGFTGTPIFDFNKKTISGKYNISRSSIDSDAVTLTTPDIFGEPLHEYTIADGIRDGNVLAFDIDAAKLMDDGELRIMVALDKSGIASVADVPNASALKQQVYYEYVNDAVKHPMAGYRDENDKYVRGIEDDVPIENYETDSYRNAVVDDICKQWPNRSVGGKFHALFVCSSIKEACIYYRMFLQDHPELRVTCMFDENETSTTPWNVDGKEKHEIIDSMLEKYNERYKTNFTFKTYDQYKNDVRLRLAHKEQYKGIESDKRKDEQLDIVIVVDQLLTGYDSKWINAMYLDKMLYGEHIIQAFSRTNRLCGAAKQHGYIRYYRKTSTMERDIEEALLAYSNNQKTSVFKVNKLKENINEMNNEIIAVRNVFISAGIPDFSHLPEDQNDQWNFVKHFEIFAKRLEAAIMQGFSWKKKCGYKGTEKEYRTFLQRYDEFMKQDDSERTKSDPRVPLDVTYGNFGTSTLIADTRYFNNILKKVYEAKQSDDTESEEQFKQELHSSFASRSVTDQKYLTMLLHDIDYGDFEYDDSLMLNDYIEQYKVKTQSDTYKDFGKFIGIEPDILEEYVKKIPVGNAKERNNGQYLNALKNMADPAAIAKLLEMKTGRIPKTYTVKAKIGKILVAFCEHIDRLDRNMETEAFDPTKYLD